MDKDCIIIYAGCGQGHKKAAQGLQEYFHFSSWDILNFAPGFLRRIYSQGYYLLVKYFPFLWQGFFILTKIKAARFLLDKFHLLL